MQENGLVNHWLAEERFNITIKNSSKGKNRLSNLMNCMMDVLKLDRKFHLNKTQFLIVTLKGLRFLFYIILGGFAISIIIFIAEIIFCVSKFCTIKL